jgi:hypothetical protein
MPLGVAHMTEASSPCVVASDFFGQCASLCSLSGGPMVGPLTNSGALIKKILTMQHKNERIGGVDLDWRITCPC